MPFVLVHDMFMGVAIWNQNLDALSRIRPVYALDLPGWGRSSRPNFSTDPTLVELEHVEVLEDWRKALKIEKMILVGHGFGECGAGRLSNPQAASSAPPTRWSTPVMCGIWCCAIRGASPRSRPTVR